MRADSRVVDGGSGNESMRRVRITGKFSALNLVERFGAPGRTLGSYFAEAGGLDLTLDDPWGGTHNVSLAPFAHENPDQYFVIRFVVSREDDDFDPDYSNAMVLKEFELPPGIQLPWLDET